MSVREVDKYNTLFGFIEHRPNNIFFHEFDNLGMGWSYVGKELAIKLSLMETKRGQLVLGLLRTEHTMPFF